jgi:hypothetical protein
MIIADVHFDNEFPDECSACGDEFNGNYYVRFEVGNVRFVAPFCGMCADRLIRQNPQDTDIVYTQQKVEVKK